MTDDKHPIHQHTWLRKPVLAAAATLAAHLASAANGVAAADTAAAPQTELNSVHSFALTLQRLATGFERAGLTVFARIDHQAAAAQAGLTMPPTTVLIYGNPRGGTPIMLAAPQSALDLPLRVLVREDQAGQTLVSFHPAREVMRNAQLQGHLADELSAPLSKAEGVIAAAVQP